MDRVDWQSARCVFVVKPACPECGHGRWHAIHTKDNWDGSSTMKAICRRCAAAFKIIHEPALPSSGNRRFDVA